MARTRRNPLAAAILSNRKVRRYRRAAQSAHAAASDPGFYLAIAAGVVFFAWYFARI